MASFTVRSRDVMDRHANQYGGASCHLPFIRCPRIDQRHGLRAIRWARGVVPIFLSLSERSLIFRSFSPHPRVQGCALGLKVVAIRAITNSGVRASCRCFWSASKLALLDGTIAFDYARTAGNSFCSTESRWHRSIARSCSRRSMYLFSAPDSDSPIDCFPAN
jgi:hypothetical protein